MVRVRVADGHVQAKLTPTSERRCTLAKEAFVVAATIEQGAAEQFSFNVRTSVVDCAR